MAEGQSTHFYCKRSFRVDGDSMHLIMITSANKSIPTGTLRSRLWLLCCSRVRVHKQGLHTYLSMIFSMPQKCDVQPQLQHCLSLGTPGCHSNVKRDQKQHAEDTYLTSLLLAKRTDLTDYFVHHCDRAHIDLPCPLLEDRDETSFGIMVRISTLAHHTRKNTRHSRHRQRHAMPP